MERGLGLINTDDTGWTGNGKNFFLGIGIDQYHHWGKLHNAVKDVNDIVSVLTTQYQFEIDEVHTLFDGDATEGTIYNKIRELKRTIQPEDNLIVYYSGHGHYDDEFEEGYWIPVDAAQDTEDRYISNANIIKRINALNTHHTLMIVDSCFSGTLVVKKRSGLTDERFKSRRILASGRQETVADGQPGENSPFAAGILTYLKKNTEKAINTTTLVQYVKDYVETKARQTPVEGRIQNSADEGGEFVFHLKVDEQSLWQSVQEKNTAESFANYLDYYPSGLFANQAERHILELKEDDIWRSAKIKDSELAYENYIKKYAPNGKYIPEAKERLGSLQTAQKARLSALDEMAKKEEERDNIRKEYDNLVATAENLFANKELPQARERYREAIRYYMPGFVPNSAYIEEQIGFCSNGITFLNHYENGRKAMDNYNYRLALQYFGEALKVDDNPKVEDLIKYCRVKLDEASREPKVPETPMINVQQTVKTPPKTAPQPAFQQAQAPPKKKKKSNLLLIVGGVFIGLLILSSIITSISNEGTYDDYQEGLNLVEDYSEPSQEKGTKSAPITPAVPTYADLIVGNWQLSTFYSNDPNANARLQTMNGMWLTYAFYPNGQVMTNGTFGSGTYNYYLNGSQLSIPGDVENSNIDQLDRQNFVVTVFYNDNGYQYSIVWSFKRMG